MNSIYSEVYEDCILEIYEHDILRDARTRCVKRCSNAIYGEA